MIYGTDVCKWCDIWYVVCAIDVSDAFLPGRAEARDGEGSRCGGRGRLGEGLYIIRQMLRSLSSLA